MVADIQRLGFGRAGLRAFPAEVAPACFAVFIFLFTYDAAHNRLGSSNGKFISFVDTCLGVWKYRQGVPASLESSLGLKRGFYVLLVSFFIKFAAGTAVSMLLGEPPVWLKGGRHTYSFLFGVALLWLAPQDFAYQYMERSRAVRLLMDMGGGLYKMRKAIYAVEAAAMNGRGGLPLAMLVAVLAIDGSTLTRRAVLWLEKKVMAEPPKRQKLSRRSSFLGDVTLENLRTDGCWGTWSAICGTVVPLTAVTAVVWHASCTELTADGITDDSFLGLRALLLAIFVWRAGTFDELARIHIESLAFADAVAQHEANRVSRPGRERRVSQNARVAMTMMSDADDVKGDGGVVQRLPQTRSGRVAPRSR